MGGYQEPPTHSPPSPPKKVGGKYDRETYEKAKQLYNEGYSIPEISEMLDIPIRTLNDWLLYGAGYRKYLGETRRYNLEEYYLVKQLYREGYTMVEICRKTGIPKHIIRNWIKRGKQPIDYKAASVKYFNRWIESIHPYKKEYYKLFYDPTKWRYIVYLYGVTITDGTIYKHRGGYTIRVIGEKLFLQRVNRAIFNAIGKEYSIFPHKVKAMYVMNISNRSLTSLLKTLHENREIARRIIEFNEELMRLFILGLVDGDGYNYNYRLGLLKSKRWWVISYSSYLLRKLGVHSWWIKQRRKGETHQTKYGVYITAKRDRFGWECSAANFIRKVGPTIKIQKNDRLPKYIQRLLEETKEPF